MRSSGNTLRAEAGTEEGEPVTGKRWIRILLRAAGVTAVTAPILRPWPGATPGTPAAFAADTSQTLEQDLNQQEGVLDDPKATAEQKEEAARLLVLRDRPEARTILQRILSEGGRTAQNAVAKALAGDPHPDANFIERLLPLLGRDKESTEAAARALANYKENSRVLGELVKFANDRRPGLEASRAAAIRAIGTIVNKDAVAALIQLIQTPGESSAIPNAATDALVEVTGLEDYARDVPAWLAWWNFVSQRPAGDLRAEWLARREEKVGRLQTQLQRLADGIRGVLADTYQRASDEKLQPLQIDLLLRWLHDSEAPVRLASVQIANDEWRNTGRIFDPVKKQLREMVGDSSTEVRLEVIKTLRATNDAEALGPLLKELKLEKDPDVKAEIAKALGPLGKVDAVDPLIELLNDPSVRVREAAAHSLGQLGDVIRAVPGLPHKVAEALKAALQWSDAHPGTRVLREEVLEGMSKLRLPELREVFDGYTTDDGNRNTPRVRRAAYLGLGNIDGLGPRYSDDIANNLAVALERESEPSVRLAIIDAIGTIGSMNQAEALYRRMQDPNESPDVRDEGWKILKSFFSNPGTTADALYRWVDAFGAPADSARQRDVLLAQIPKLKADHKDDDLAAAEQNLGAADARLGQLAKPDQAAAYFQEAVTNFQAALDYWKQKPDARPAVIEQLVDELMGARLDARQYTDVVKLAGESIAADPKLAENIGRAIRQKTDKLREAGDLQSALDLINATDAMQPPLRGQYKQQLETIRAQLKQQLGT